MFIDSHFHVFKAAEIDQALSRYTVNYDAPLETWRSLAVQHGLSAGVIVQPSFLGLNNDHMLQVIASAPENLRGIAVVAPSASLEALEALQARGVEGIRLNLSGEASPSETLRNHLALTEYLAALGMHLQIHHDEGYLNELLLAIPAGVGVVIDHFGRPESLGELRSCERAIHSHQGNLWVKLSAPYRSAKLNHRDVFRFWLEAIGETRLLWGSDWPHTRFETATSYAEQVQALYDLTSDTQLIEQILSNNPKTLYWRS